MRDNVIVLADDYGRRQGIGLIMIGRNISKIVHFNDDVRHGIEYHFNNNGSLRSLAVVIDGVLSGHLLDYDGYVMTAITKYGPNGIPLECVRCTKYGEIRCYVAYGPNIGVYKKTSYYASGRIEIMSWVDGTGAVLDRLVKDGVWKREVLNDINGKSILGSVSEIVKDINDISPVEWLDVYLIHNVALIKNSDYSY